MDFSKSYWIILLFYDRVSYLPDALRFSLRAFSLLEAIYYFSVYTHTHTHTHVCIYILIYSCISLCLTFSYLIVVYLSDCFCMVLISGHPCISFPSCILLHVTGSVGGSNPLSVLSWDSEHLIPTSPVFNFFLRTDDSTVNYCLSCFF